MVSERNSTKSFGNGETEREREGESEGNVQKTCEPTTASQYVRRRRERRQTRRRSRKKGNETKRRRQRIQCVRAQLTRSISFQVGTRRKWRRCGCRNSQSRREFVNADKQGTLVLTRVSFVNQRKSSSYGQESIKIRRAK